MYASSTWSLGDLDFGVFENGNLALTLHYNNGDFCGSIGEDRSSEVRFTFGETTALVSAGEPSTCFYAFEMTCNPNDPLARKSRRMEFLPTIPNSTVV